MNRYILILSAFLLLHTQAKAWVGGDVIRAGMFYTYAKQAKQTLIAQDAAMEGTEKVPSWVMLV